MVKIIVTFKLGRVIPVGQRLTHDKQEIGISENSLNEKAYKAIVKDSKGFHTVLTESFPAVNAGLATLDKHSVIHINCKLSDHCDNGDKALVSQLSVHTDSNSEELDSQPFKWDEVMEDLVRQLGYILMIARLKYWTVNVASMPMVTPMEHGNGCVLQGQIFPWSLSLLGWWLWLLWPQLCLRIGLWNISLKLVQCGKHW